MSSFECTPEIVVPSRDYDPNTKKCACGNIGFRNILTFDDYDLVKRGVKHIKDINIITVCVTCIEFKIIRCYKHPTLEALYNIYHMTNSPNSDVT